MKFEKERGARMAPPWERTMSRRWARSARSRRMVGRLTISRALSSSTVRNSCSFSTRSMA